VGPSQARALPLLPIGIVAALLIATAVLSFFGAGVLNVTAAAVDELLTPSSYIRAVGLGVSQPQP
jgi:hypothetical protein